jgi:hypothetical protein
VSRGALVTLLFVAAGLLLPFALVGLWAQQVLLDRERFTNLSDNLLEREVIRQALADEIVTQVESRQSLGGSAPTVKAGIAGALGTPQYRTLFKGALGDVHDQLTSDEDTIRLDVGPAVDLARTQNAQVARSLPRGSDVPPIVVARRSEVPVLWGAVDGARRVALLTPLVVLVVLALAVAVSQRRWRTVGIAGTVVAGASLVLLGLMALAKTLVGRILDPFVARDGFNAAWDVIARSLANTTLIVVVGAVVVGAGGFVIDQILTRRPSY